MKTALDLLRECHASGFTAPRTARKLMKAHRVAEHVTAPWLSQEDALRAFYGGRQQVFRYGTFGPVWRYDMNSAYGWALDQVYSLADARVSSIGRGDWSILYCQRSWSCHNPLQSHAYREEDGLVSYPPSGRGFCWMSRRAFWGDLETGIKGEVFVLEPALKHSPFSYLSLVYAEGKLSEDDDYTGWCKSVIRCTWGNLMLPGWECYSPAVAGIVCQIVTDYLQAQLCHVADRILLWNVDGVVSTEPLPWLPIGGAWGEFRCQKLEGITIDTPRFGPGSGHPEPGTDRWNSWWPTEEFRNPAVLSAPYRRLNPAPDYGAIYRQYED